MQFADPSSFNTNEQGPRGISYFILTWEFNPNTRLITGGIYNHSLFGITVVSVKLRHQKTWRNLETWRNLAGTVK